MSLSSRPSSGEKLLFIKRLLKNPKALGAVAPSSKALARLISQNVTCQEDAYILEVGAGTGSFTKALLKSGVNDKQLIVVELDPELCSFLRQKFPSLTIIEGNAFELDKLIPANVIGKIDTIVSGIPLINLNKKEQSLLIKSFRHIAHSKSQILQFTYGPLSPIPHRQFGLQAKRVGHVLLNVPPATVWQYTFLDYFHVPSKISFKSAVTKVRKKILTQIQIKLDEHKIVKRKKFSTKKLMIRKNSLLPFLVLKGRKFKNTFIRPDRND